MAKLKRISESESHNYIPVDEDFTNSPKTYFTITPDPNKPGWEKVTYYTSRKKNIYENREGDGDSWVYILTNISMPHLIKIGHTDKTPDERAFQISRSTGVPLEFNVSYAFRCFNARMFELELHRYLKEYRLRTDREFFQMSVEQAKEIIIKLGQRYK